MKIRFRRLLTAGLLAVLLTGCTRDAAPSTEASGMGSSQISSGSVPSVNSAAPAVSTSSKPWIPDLPYETYFAQERQLNDNLPTIYHSKTVHSPDGQFEWEELYGGEKRLSNLPFDANMILATTREFLFLNGGRAIFGLDCLQDRPEFVCESPVGECIIQIHRADPDVVFFETSKHIIYRYYRPKPKLDRLLELPQQDFANCLVMNNNEIVVETFTPLYYELVNKYGEQYKDHVGEDTPIVKRVLYNFRTGGVREVDDREWNTSYASSTIN